MTLGEGETGLPLPLPRALSRIHQSPPEQRGSRVGMLAPRLGLCWSLGEAEVGSLSPDKGERVSRSRS